jgi:uncharacterized protein
MRVVLDTNVLLVSISRKSQYHPIYKSLLRGDYQSCVTVDIWEEYEEKIGEHMGELVAKATMEALDRCPDVLYFKKYFYFYAIKADPDDDKFVDCAVAGNVDFIVTNDNHFNVLKKLGFPKIQVLSADEFLNLVSTQYNLQ